MNLTNIEKLTFQAMAARRMPFKSSESGYHWVQLADNVRYRIVSPKTIASLIAKNLIIKNGESFLITKYASQFLVPVEYRVNWNKLRDAT